MNLRSKTRWIKASLITLCISTLHSATCLAADASTTEQPKDQAIEKAATPTAPATVTATQTTATAPTSTPISSTIDSKALAQFASILAISGITYTQNQDHIIVNINKDKALAAIPEVQSMGGMNADITPAEIKTHAIQLATQVGLFYTIAIVQYVYLIPTTGNIQASINLITLDNGKEISNPIATFDFTRKLNNKINYDKLTPESLPKSAPNFHYTTWYNEHNNDQ